MSARRCEVLVAGGGPAGCAAALLLTRWGHDVDLVVRAPSPSAHLAESIPPSTGKLFDLLGVRDVIDRAGFTRSTGNTVWWGARTRRVEAFADGALGWQVTADRLEAILQKAALDTGVHLEHGRLTVEEALGRGAAFLLDCTGRAGLIARARGWRILEPAHRTVALVGHWQADRAFDVPDRTHTLIESYENGWAWSVPASNTHRYVAVMVDPRTSDLSHDRQAREVYLAEVAKTMHVAALTRTATLTQGPSGWDASMYRSTTYAADDVLLVGDAGNFIDPLSSIGVKKALASAWLAAVATHTALIRPAMRKTALDFFAAREAEIYAAFRSMTTLYLAEAATAHGHAFWTDRTEHDVSNAHQDVAAFQAAFDRIRAAESLRVRRAPGLRVDERPAIAGCEVVMEARVVSDRQSAGVRYLFDVDVVALIEMAPEHSQVPDLFETYNGRYPPVSLPDFLSALSAIVANGWLVHET